MLRYARRLSVWGRGCIGQSLISFCAKFQKKNANSEKPMLTESRPGRVLRCCDGFFLRTFAGRAVRPSPECRTSSPTTSSRPRFDGEPPRSWQGREEEAAMARVIRMRVAWLESRRSPSLSHLWVARDMIPITGRLNVCKRGNSWRNYPD